MWEKMAAVVLSAGFGEGGSVRLPGVPGAEKACRSWVRKRLVLCSTSVWLICERSGSQGEFGGAWRLVVEEVFRAVHRAPAMLSASIDTM